MSNHQDKARLYCELHITCQPTGDFEAFKQEVAELFKDTWRVSRFDEDLVDNYHGKWFLSARGESKQQAASLMSATLFSLAYLTPIKILRWKIEDTLLDSQYGDGADGLAEMMAEHPGDGRHDQ